MARRGRPSGETYKGYVGAYNRKMTELANRGKEMRVPLLTEDEWKDVHKSNPYFAEGQGKGNKEIVEMSAYGRSRAQAKAIQEGIKQFEELEKQQAKAHGYKYVKTFTNPKLIDLRTEGWDMEQDFWDTVKNRQHELINAGYTWTQINKQIGIEFFGS